MPRISRRLFLGSVATLAACPLSAKEPVSIKNNDWHEVTRVFIFICFCYIYFGIWLSFEHAAFFSTI